MNGNIVMLDGAVGTNLWEMTGDHAPVWRFNIERPDAVRALHTHMADAGAQILLTNTFGANAGAVRGSPYTVERVVREGVRLCREAAGARARVALSIGPLTGLMEPYGDITPEQAAAMYDEMLRAGMAEKPDIILLQTFIDVEMLKIAAACARQYDAPLFAAMSFERVGKTIMGNSVTDMLAALAPYSPDAVGLNCSLGPEAALPVLAAFRRETDLPLLLKPNAGRALLQDGHVVSEYAPERFVRDLLPALDMDVAYLGGCCGATPRHMRLLRAALDGRALSG